MSNKNYLRLLILLVVLVAGCNSGQFRYDASVLENERFPRPVALTYSDIKWFRDFGVAWIFSGNGSPAFILPELTLKSQGELYEGGERAQAILRRFERVFTTFAVYARLDPGGYSINPERIIGKLPTPLTVRTEFELTPTHITLMRSAWWREGYIDFKYPYGSYNYYEADIALALGKDIPKNSVTGVFELSKVDQKAYQRLHQELLFALQVFVQYAQIEPGNYQLPVDGWDSSIVRLHPPTEQQIKTYMKNAVRLKNKFIKGEGDSVIDWMKLNEEFSKVVEHRDN